MFISEITVDEGPKLKRWHPMSRGRAYPIIKRTSHIALTISDTNTEPKKESKDDKKQIEKPKIQKTKVKKTIRKAKAKK